MWEISRLRNYKKKSETKTETNFIFIKMCIKDS